MGVTNQAASRMRQESATTEGDSPVGESDLTPAGEPEYDRAR